MSLKIFRRNLVLKIVPRLAWAILWLLHKTCKNHYFLANSLSEKQFIVSCWHGELGMIGFSYLKLKKPHIYVIASQHFDGSIAAGLFESFGFKNIRGSSKKGGVRVLIEGLKHLKEGYDVGITPDGPKGPRHSIADGVVALAQKSGVGVSVCRVICKNAWQFNTWDKFEIPKPFSEVRYYMLEPVVIPREWELSKAKEYLKMRMDNCEQEFYQTQSIKRG
ncbi:lysophospholipid acyltransferase family protein [Helicobacter cetorum]|uniref:lysophospholipid acyltransferase family protein n=1 Tax=Helicobacter cetorum TaxID=138563 RepID=UPI0005C4DE6F|nr:lysophospholipid acyltransferase family protein [Helicobacter cetorum]